MRTIAALWPKSSGLKRKVHCLLSVTLLALSAQAQQMTVEHLFRRPFVWGTSPSQISWAKHAHKLGFLWNMRGGAFRDLYVYDADTRKLTRLTDLENLKDPLNQNEAETDIHRKNYLPPQAGVSSYDLSDDGQRAVLVYRGDLFLVSTSGGAWQRLTKTKAAESSPQFAPDGNKIAFSQGGQLYIVSLNGGSLEQRTDIRAPAVLTGFRWAPDGKHLSYSVRATTGRTMPLPNYSGQFVLAPNFPRDVAGDPPSITQHYVVASTGDEPPLHLDTGRGFGFRPLVWSEDSRYLALVTRPPDYKSQDLQVVDASTGRSKVVYHQADDRWVETADYGWSSDSSALWFTSDASGFQHVYTVSPDGTNLKQITKGGWEIHNDTFSHSPQWVGDSIYFSSTQAGPSERQFYRVKPDGSSEPERLTQSEGLHVVWLSEDGKSRAEMRADLKTPFDLYVDGERVTTSTQPEFPSFPWARSRFVTYPSLKDHKQVSARLLLPPDFDPDKKNAKPRPAIVYIHGSGYATSVLKQWGSYQDLRFVFNNILAHQGYPILEMDYRGSTGYGRDWRSGVYLDMGGPDLDDILGGVEYLRSLQNIDMKRVGIWGWSYGGFMTAMALFRAPGTFLAGAAFSGVYDWANYNANYTGERLTTPAENPEAYLRSSPIHFTRQLRDHLLLLHGMSDDNVLFQEAAQLSEKLIAEDKRFDEVFYPEESHAYMREQTLRDAFSRVERFFNTYLGSVNLGATR